MSNAVLISATRYEVVQIKRSHKYWDDYLRTRLEVYEGQGVTADEEVDEHDFDDLSTFHMVLVEFEGSPEKTVEKVIGTVRLRPVGSYLKLERVALRENWQGRGLGELIVIEALKYYFKKFPERIMVAHAQVQKMGFYERLGFFAVSPVFDEKLRAVSIPHRTIVFPTFCPVTAIDSAGHAPEYDGDCYDAETQAHILSLLNEPHFVYPAALTALVPFECGVHRKCLKEAAWKLQALILNKIKIWPEAIGRPEADKTSPLEVKEVLDKLVQVGRDRLNIGIYADIPECWRTFFTVAKFAQALLTVYLQGDVSRALRAVDEALIMGRPENLPRDGLFIKHFATGLQKATPTPAIDFHAIASHAYPSPTPRKIRPQPWWELAEYEHFDAERIAEKIESGMPCVVRGFAAGWPASEKWSPEYLSNVAGGRTVPVEIGSRYDGDDWNQKLMTINEFLRDFLVKQDSESPGYLAQHRLFDQIPELLDEIEPHQVEQLGAHVDWNMWFGPGGTVSSMHFDPRENFFVQIYGSKFVRLAHPSDSEKLCPREDLLKNTSQINMQDPDGDVERFPSVAQVHTVDVVLHPGDALLIPSQFWHFVKALNTSISVSAWFDAK
ncbi:unnamed protein product, partial [Mesorhabditis spiculigera]